jgi:hypothetical protein
VIEAPPRRHRPEGPTARLAIAVVALLAVSIAGLGAAALGLVPHRVPVPTIDAASAEHVFPDIEAHVPTVVDGRAMEAVSSFTGTDAADDESLYGGVYTILSDELATGPDPAALDRLEIAAGFLPGGTGRAGTSVIAYRLPGRSGAGWRTTLDTLLANAMDEPIWAFRRDTIGGRSVLVGRDDRGADGDWVYESGDVVIEVMSDDQPTVERILGLLK